MIVTTPELPCACCHKPAKVYNPDDMCSRCQRRVAHAMSQLSYVDRDRQGWRRMTDRGGNFAGWVKSAFTSHDA